ncbi:hypothetical protein G6F30_002403 [Rhizopus arrhizus]|nr:hypothetical protein G6F30_002403 [Rhizopus arrhizus]
MIPQRLYVTSLSQYRQQLSNKDPEAWNNYLQVRQELRREDFVLLRSTLWKSKTWDTEGRVLRVLQDMKERGMSWGTLEYNEYFIAKLFFNEYQDILDVYEGEFQQNNVHLTIGSFNVMVATFLLTDQKDKAIQLIKEAQNKWHITPDIRDFERTIRRALPTNKQLVELAKELIVEHGITDTETLNSNLMHLFREKRLDEVKQLLKEYKGHELDVNSYNLLIKGFADARMNREATGYYKEMESKKMKPNAYICTTMLDIYAHARDIQSAEEVVRQTVLGGHTVDEVIYNQLIKVYFKCRQPRKAFLAFEEIQKSKRLQMNEVILNTMVNGLVINKELKVANKIYQQMIQTKFKPDIVTFNTMLKGYADVGDLGSALEVIKDMFRLNQEPDIVTFTTFINSIFDTKTPKSAEDMMNLLYEMGVKPNIYTFNSMINGWIRVNKMSEAEKTLNIMMTDYKELKPTVHTFTNLIQGYIEQMNLNKAMKTFQTLLQHGIEPDRATFNFMIVGFLNFDRLEDAEDLRDWFVRQETTLFKFRFEQEPMEEKKAFLQKLNLNWKMLSEEEKENIREELEICCQALLRSKSDNPTLAMIEQFVNMETFFEVDFEKVPNLVGNRLVYLKQGKAYVPMSEQVNIVMNEYQDYLYKSLESTAKLLPRIEEDDRLKPILLNVEKQYVGKSYNNADVDYSGSVTANEVDTLVKRHAPLCMRHLHDGLRTNKHLRHEGRLQYGLFLKGIGLSVEEALVFWRRAFSDITDDKFQKNYAYNVRYNYGLEGRRVNYNPYSCTKIISGTAPGTGEYHGCPFRHGSDKSLEAKLFKDQISRSHVDEILDLVRSKHYQLACTRYFEATHLENKEKIDPIEHPNQYYELSKKLAENNNNNNHHSEAMEIDG